VAAIGSAQESDEVQVFIFLAEQGSAAVAAADACTLLTRNEAESILGQPIRDAEPGDINNLDRGKADSLFRITGSWLHFRVESGS
jgi:hypothetical protein